MTIKVEIDKKKLDKIKKILEDENGFKGNYKEIIEFIVNNWLTAN